MAAVKPTEFCDVLESPAKLPTHLQPEHRYNLAGKWKQDLKIWSVKNMVQEPELGQQTLIGWLWKGNFWSFNWLYLVLQLYILTKTSPVATLLK